jgi:hypothetical protein
MSLALINTFSYLMSDIMPGVLNDQSCSPVKRNPPIAFQSGQETIRRQARSPLRQNSGHERAYWKLGRGRCNTGRKVHARISVPFARGARQRFFAVHDQKGDRGCRRWTSSSSRLSRLPWHPGLESAAKPSISTSSGDKFPATSRSWVVAAISYPLSSRMHLTMCWRSTEVRRLCDGNRNTERDRRSASGQSPR